MSKYIEEQRRYHNGTATWRRTDHSEEIEDLRKRAGNKDHGANTLLLAADLLEMHDATGISLDRWATARKFVEDHIGAFILENGV